MASNAIKNDIPNGQGHATATADVSDVLRQLRSRSPEESLGLKAESGLWKGFLQATVGTVILFAVLTAGPYLLDKQFPPPAKPTKAQTSENADNNTPTPPSTEGPLKKGPEAIAVQPKVTTGKKDITDVLGESGTKNAKPSVNPLDRKDDDLLKDLK